MYRIILVVIYLGSAYAAPQDRIEATASQEAISEESRIENIPLSIPGNSEKTIRQIDNEDTTPLPIDADDDTPYTLNFFINDIKTTVSDFENTEPDAKSTTKPDSDIPRTEKPDLDEKSTEKIDFESYKPTSKPRYYSKLSYFEKKDNNAILTNLVEHKSSRRKFRSNCRCEKISNCPKLQITVPRCPEEQFMCCF